MKWQQFSKLKFLGGELRETGFKNEERPLGIIFPNPSYSCRNPICKDELLTQLASDKVIDLGFLYESMDFDVRVTKKYCSLMLKSDFLMDFGELVF